jgi:hypothetical protein
MARSDNMPQTPRPPRRVVTIAGLFLVLAGFAWFFLTPSVLPRLAAALPFVDPGVTPLLGFLAIIAGSLIASEGKWRLRGKGRDITISINASPSPPPPWLPPDRVLALPYPGGPADETARFADMLSRMPDDAVRDLARLVADSPGRSGIVAGLDWARNQAATPEARAQIERLLDLLS